MLQLPRCQWDRTFLYQQLLQWPCLASLSLDYDLSAAPFSRAMAYFLGTEKSAWNTMERYLGSKAEERGTFLSIRNEARHITCHKGWNPMKYIAFTSGNTGIACSCSTTTLPTLYLILLPCSIRRTFASHLGNGQLCTTFERGMGTPQCMHKASRIASSSSLHNYSKNSYWWTLVWGRTRFRLHNAALPNHWVLTSQLRPTQSAHYLARSAFCKLYDGTDSPKWFYGLISVLGILCLGKLRLGDHCLADRATRRMDSLCSIMLPTGQFTNLVEPASRAQQQCWPSSH